MMRSVKKWLGGLLCLALLLTLLPTALAADGDPAPWAAEAVQTLNGIYGENVFSAEDSPMTVAELNTLMGKTGWKIAKAGSNDSENLSRGTACEVLADVFDLPVPEGKTAIQYLYDQNIINGKANGDLAESDPVTKAQFAVLTYRVLNSVGGGEGWKEDWPAPGSKGYTAWMYLAVRKCVPFEMDQADTTIKSATIATYGGSTYKEDRLTIDGGTTKIYDVTTAEKTGEAIWTAWTAAMQDPNLGGSSVFTAPAYQESDTLLEAAIRMVEARNDADPVIFHDVEAGNWFYDGIMYLVNNDIVIGFGDGQFGPDVVTPRYELAVLLATVDGTVLTIQSGPGRVIEAIQNAVTKGYMTGTVPTTSEEAPWNPGQDTYWSAPATREEAAVGILKMIEKKYSIDTTSDNLSILDRFNDKGDIADVNSKPYLAYAVSMGLLSGTSENTLDPDDEVSRAQVGVLLYRTLIGVDKSKMQDYRESVDYVLSAGDSGAATAPAEQGIALFAAPLAETRTGTATLTLREDWRLTENLDLNVPEGVTLTIQGNGFHIYEMPGQLTNSGAGTVRFAEGTILYPAGNSGTCNTETSNALMVERHTYAYTITVAGSITGGTVSANPMSAKEGDTVTLTVQPASGYTLSGVTVTAENGQTVTVTGSTFTMPASDVTVSATFTVSQTSGGNTGGSSSRPSNTITTTERNPDGSTTTTTTNKTTGTVTETTRYPDGSREVVETKKDGTVTTTTTDANGTSASAVTDPDGRTEAEVSVSARAVDAAQEDGGAVTLPIPNIPVSDSGEDASLVEIDLPRSAGAVKVEIPAEDAGPGTVAVLVNDDGTEAVVKKSVALDGGLTLTLEAGAAVKLVDNSKDFDDTYGHWAADAIDFVTAHEMFGGTSAATFSPDSSMTRGMLAVVLHRFEDTPSHTFTGGFEDVAPGSWYAEAIGWAAEQGIIGGYGDGRYGADDAITREQLAVMLWRYAGRPDSSYSLDRFTDADAVGGYARTALAWASENGIVGGYADGSINPKGQATRAHVAVMLMRMCVSQFR